jgi:hypothetical protein
MNGLSSTETHTKRKLLVVQMSGFTHVLMVGSLHIMDFAGFHD